MRITTMGIIIIVGAGIMVTTVTTNGHFEALRKSGASAKHASSPVGTGGILKAKMARRV